MKKVCKKISLALLILLVSSCYDSFLDYEGNQSIINSEDGTSSSTGELGTRKLAVEFMRAAQSMLVSVKNHQYQYQYSFVADDYAGYMSCPHNFDGRLKSTLAFFSQFAGGTTEVFNKVAQQTVPVMRSTEKLGITPIGAMASILFSDAALQFANTHGPTPLTDYKALKEKHPLNYEKLSEVYTLIFNDLITAEQQLAEYTNEDPDLGELIKQVDGITGQSEVDKIIDSWRKYANSLILRMAMTVVDVENYTCRVDNQDKTAQQLAEEAVQRGVFEEEDKGIYIQPGTNLFDDRRVHPLYSIANEWIDARLNASYHNYLLRTQNPILEYWFANNYGDIRNQEGKIKRKNSDIMSMRSGTRLATPAMCASSYLYYSRFKLIFSAEYLYIVKPEEVLFLRSEGALRGWNMGGTVDKFYNSGIRKFLKSHSFSDSDVDKYMSWKGVGDQSTNEDIKQQCIYHDWVDKDNDLPKWDGYYQLNNSLDPVTTNKYCKSGDKEQMLQKIITQKWITLFPMSLIAWTDYRRTGYPQLLPYVPFAYGYSDGTLEEPRFNWLTGELISEGTTVRRLPYPSADAEIAEEVALSASAALNDETTGPKYGDKSGTRLWWDILPKPKLK